eukprot:1159848-Pelagomonas_calceolata.AAC.3
MLYCNRQLRQKATLCIQNEASLICPLLCWEHFKNTSFSGVVQLCNFGEGVAYFPAPGTNQVGTAAQKGPIKGPAVSSLAVLHTHISLL